jgi:hypothetical protein
MRQHGGFRPGTAVQSACFCSNDSMIICLEGDYTGLDFT